MTEYCALYDVKKRLQIQINDVSSDPELADVIAEAQAIIDVDLASAVTTPLTTVPDLIKYACADLAAGIFKSRRAKAEAHGNDLAAGFRKAYDEKIAKYLATLSGPSPLYISEDTS